MWISGKLADGTKDSNEISVGTVLSSGDGKVTVTAGGEYKQIAVLCPAGITGMPLEGDEVVVFPTGDGAVCSPVSPGSSGVLPGEIMIRAASGAYIHLKADGTAVINGRVFAKEAE